MGSPNELDDDVPIARLLVEETYALDVLVLREAIPYSRPRQTQVRRLGNDVTAEMQSAYGRIDRPAATFKL
ncbi:hypothetical protein [Microbacterium hydrocarbonoxydans]|uniref:Uncharacterized protein n=1 Tax=Microbacterium hydrocarbonoxydans TaxID=273678 RepID=A0A1H4L8I8_9MICO|nr:hypothetical protein [Microbacterium hydrocarbonoxydans]SEB66768.1 hypothetical protein SAMN04489807_1694 [Microbacterium hydrocarbonoxydans]